MRISLGLSLFLYSALSLAAFPGKLDVYALLLTSAKPDDVKMGARSLLQDTVKDPALLDMAAGRLCEYVQAGDDEQGMDNSDNREAVSWLARALAGSGDTKYRPLLEQALAKTDDKANKQAFSMALAQLPAGAGASAAMPACPSRADLRAKVLAGRAPSKPAAFADAAFKSGATLDDVLQKLGVPTAARYYEDDASRHLSRDDIAISYLNGPTLRFYYEGGWKVSEVIPNEQDAAADSAGPDAGLLDGVLSGDKDVVSDTVDGLKDRAEFPVAVLDAAALRMWRHRDVDDGDQLDASKDLCELFDESRNARYRDFLKQMQAQAKAKKLRKCADDALDDLTEGEVEQFAVPAN